MKRLLLLVCILSSVAFYGYSQSLSLSNPQGSIVANSIIVQAGTPDSSELITYLYVKNTSSSAINVICKKVELNMLDSTEIYMCWAGGCYPSSIYVSPFAQPIAAGQTITEFVGHYAQIMFNHFKPGESVVRWVFYDQVNTNDSVSVTIKYTTYPVGIEEAGASQVKLSNAYPNPADATAGFNYSVPAGLQATILIRNLVGTTVQTEQVPGGTGKMNVSTSNLSDGIYFYSLMVDGKISQTRKLVVKH